MKRIVDTSFHFLIVVFGLFLLSGVGSLLAYDTEVVVTIGYYIDQLHQSLIDMMEPSSITVYWGERDRQYSLFRVFLSTYGYSFAILLSSFFFAVCFSVIISYLIMLMPRRGYRFSLKTLNVLDALPDVFIVVSFQVIIIWFYKKTNLLLFNLYTLGNEKTYFLPILCLSILPVVFLVKQFIFQLKEEDHKPYVEFSYAKGFRKSYTVWVHLFRNVWIHFFFHLKPIFLLMLSNLLVIEILFNMNGYMTVLFRASTSSPAAFFMGMLLVFVPFFIVFNTGSFFLKKWLKGEENHE